MELRELLNKLTDEEKDYLFCQQSNGKQIKVVDGKVVAVERVLTDKEKAQMRIAELKNLLENTDYIANKLAEANAKYIITEDKTELINLQTKYSKELEDRQTWREEIDGLEKLI